MYHSGGLLGHYSQGFPGSLYFYMSHIYQLNLKDATSYALGSEFKLRSEDTVYVTAAPVTRWNRVMSQITNSISNVNTLDNTFK